MASISDIYGQIGAAKQFAGNVSSSLGFELEQDEAERRELLQRLAETPETEISERNKIEKKLKRLQRKNKLHSKQEKITQGATKFLTNLLEYLDVAHSTLIKWISFFLVKTLPAIEVAVKTLLLTNIKKQLSCSIDPTIPESWRTTGELFNEALIDPRGILFHCPFDEFGKYYYFGQRFNKNECHTHELARAVDMNAFLWYAKTSARFVNPYILSNASDTFDVPEGATLYNTHKFPGKDKGYRFIEGTTFKMNAASSSIFLCENVERQTEGNEIYTIVPATDNWNGITWYKDINSLNGSGDKKHINYDNSKPLFNIQYMNTFNNSGILPEGNFKFRILPKPFSTGYGWLVDLENNVNTVSDMVNDPNSYHEVGGSTISDNNYNFQFTGIQSPIPRYARFNGNGMYDKKGRYSIDTVNYNVIQEKNNNGSIKYSIRKIGSSAPYCTMFFNDSTKEFVLRDKDGNDTLTMSDKSAVLTECYFGTTVYEFNYDYVMSMKLFDAKSVASAIIDTLVNVSTDAAKDYINEYIKSLRSGGNNPSTVSNAQQVYIDYYIDTMVQRVIESQSEEFKDCFYTLSNNDYNELEKRTADAIRNQTFVTDNSEDGIKSVYNIMDAYDADASLNERIEVIETALNKAAQISGYGSGTVGYNPSTSSVLYETGSGDGGDFIEKAVKILISSVVNALLTPKVLLLIQVNRRLMMADALPTSTDPREMIDDRLMTVKDVLNGLSGLLDGIIRQVIDEIHKEILRIILERISELMMGYLNRLGLEYALKWANLLKQLLACFKRNGSSMSIGQTESDTGNAINSILDQVDYADIDVLVDQIIPNTKNC